jgi:hypothetical protein
MTPGVIMRAPGVAWRLMNARQMDSERLWDRYPKINEATATDFDECRQPGSSSGDRVARYL